MVAVTLDKNKKYKYDKGGDLVEATVISDTDIIMAGSKSSLRRIADLERNVSILATTLTTTDGSATDASDANFDTTVVAATRFKSTVRMDGTTEHYATIQMNSNKIVDLGNPSTATDAANKSYVDSAIATAKSQLTNGASAAFDTLSEIQNAMATDSELSAAIAAITTVANANQLSTARTISLSGDATGSISFNGTANVTIPVVVADNSHAHTTANVTGLDAQITALQSRCAVLENKLAAFTAVAGGVRVAGTITATGDVTAFGA